MNTANKITMSRIFLSLVMLIILLFPWHQVGVELPIYVVNGNITIELKYIIAGVIFVVASLTDFIDGKVARKYNMVTDFGKMIDAISDKILTNTLIVVLACDNLVHPVIAVIIIARDIIVDSIKMLIGNKGKAVAAIKVAKYKTASLMIGLTLKIGSKVLCYGKRIYIWKIVMWLIKGTFKVPFFGNIITKTGC